MHKSSSYIFSADVIRVLAILGVVAIHTTNAIYTRPDFFGGSVWWIAVLLDSLSRISIPLFIMLSGYLLLNKEETFEKSLKRTWTRILLPLLAWTLIYMLWNDGHPTLKTVNLSFFSRLFSVNDFDLYFLIIILGLYCILPLLRAFIRTAPWSSQKNLLIFTLLAGIGTAAGQYLFQQCSANIFTMWVPYMGLFFAGYLLGNASQNSKRTFSLLAVYLLGLMITMGMNYMYYYFLPRGIDFLDGPFCLSQYADYYLSINVVIMSLSAFVLLLHFRYLAIKDTLIGKLVTSIARASFGIYLVHLIIVDYIETDLHLTVDHAHMPLLLYLLGTWLITFIVSYLISWLILKISVLKWLLGGK